MYTPVKDSKTKHTALGKNSHFGRVFGNKLFINAFKNDLEIDINSIHKIRLYNSVSYLYNILLLLLSVLFFVVAFSFTDSKIIITAFSALGIIGVIYSFRIKKSVHSIMITLKKEDKVIKIPVKKEMRKEADDFIFYVNGEILRLDKSRYNHYMTTKIKD
ncbi:hypothetical protein E0W68_09340 [Flavobacterium salilacus subsp. salilacus]|uniref:hypothetical protein n=1 Tax=Flavobacterium TaxID=237 RepID=UPI001075460D|nr:MULTISPECIES: hypothetical protein [Flavobacterium]KAF2518516.1 hypothetical protein E0W68_09340 [Flavobacterium salilacus subsp. salilacus]MBE1615158.1 hypothetical protein [Flavobacterium sp. SaA2.13]